MAAGQGLQRTWLENNAARGGGTLSRQTVLLLRSSKLEWMFERVGVGDEGWRRQLQRVREEGRTREVMARAV